MSENIDTTLIVEMLLKIKSLQKLLISKNIITEEEFMSVFKNEVDMFTKFLVKNKEESNKSLKIDN